MMFRKTDILFLIPFGTYLISYIYLAIYHGQVFLFGTIVHEGGTLTLLKTTFYAPHALGHLPVHTVLAFYFTGVWLMLSNFSIVQNHFNTILLCLLLAFFLALSLEISFHFFPLEDTYDFLLQRKQSVAVYGQGGSWNLHLASTILLFFFVPGYLYLLRICFQRGSRFSWNGIFYVFISLAGFLLFTLLVNRELGILLSVWGNPRYLAHSVRELVTFPLTYFPLPIAFFLRNEPQGTYPCNPLERPIVRAILIFLGIYIIGLGYQVIVSLRVGIGNLAQKPNFAKGGELGIPYLLASHFFEHFLDTIYFTLLCLLLYRLSSARSEEETVMKAPA